MPVPLKFLSLPKQRHFQQFCNWPSHDLSRSALGSYETNEDKADRLYFDINIPKEKVYYKQIFNPTNNYSHDFKIKATEIYGYIEQDDNTDCEDEWKGNHSFANALRNKITHRNSPNVAVMSDFDMNLKCHPVFQIKRVIEDYSVVSQYIKDILDQIENDIMDSFNYEEK